MQVHNGFNPRAPCGARLIDRCMEIGAEVFQSTRPVWGATLQIHFLTVSWMFQSTRPVWGATGGCFVIVHAIRFQSTRPVWGATFCRCLNECP